MPIVAVVTVEKTVAAAPARKWVSRNARHLAGKARGHIKLEEMYMYIYVERIYSDRLYEIADSPNHTIV